MIWALTFLPLLAAAAALGLRRNGPRRALLAGTAAAHAALTAACWARPPVLAPGAWVGLDAAGLLFLGIASFLFLTVSGYAAQAWRREARRHPPRDRGEERAAARAERTFTACLLAFLSAMTLAAASQHLGLLWVAVEATTLATAPLICFHRQSRSLEATWKYLLVCSVGIALALVGNFLLVVASASADGTGGTLLASELAARGTALRAPWVKAAFVFLLVG